MLDSEAAAGAQPSRRESDDRVDHPHAVRAAEQRMRRIMFGHFGFQYRAVGDVGRVGDKEVDLPVQFRQQPGR